MRWKNLDKLVWNDSIFFVDEYFWLYLIYFNLNDLLELWKMWVLVIRWFEWNIISMILEKDAFNLFLNALKMICWVLFYWFFKIVIFCCWFNLFQCHRMSCFSHSFDFIHFLKYDICFINCWLNFLCNNCWLNFLCKNCWVNFLYKSLNVRVVRRESRIRLNVIKLKFFFKFRNMQLKNFWVIFFNFFFFHVWSWYFFYF